MDPIGDQKDFKKADIVSYPYIKVTLNNLSYYIDLNQNTRWRDMDQLGHRWLTALKKNLKNKLVLEKNFCFLGFADSTRNIDFLCAELNKATKQINDFSQDWEFRHFPKIDIKENYTRDDFMYSADLPTGLCPDGNEMAKPGLRLKHETCNELHRYFEDLQGQA